MNQNDVEYEPDSDQDDHHTQAPPTYSTPESLATSAMITTSDEDPTDQMAESPKAPLICNIPQDTTNSHETPSLAIAAAVPRSHNDTNEMVAHTTSNLKPALPHQQQQTQISSKKVMQPIQEVRQRPNSGRGRGGGRITSHPRSPPSNPENQERPAPEGISLTNQTPSYGHPSLPYNKSDYFL